MPFVAGQELLAEQTTVNEGEDFVFNCTDPSGLANIVPTVNGLEAGPLVDRVVITSQMPMFTIYTLPMVRRADNGAVFGCIVQSGGTDTPTGNVTLTVNCKSYFYSH